MHRRHVMLGGGIAAAAGLGAAAIGIARSGAARDYAAATAAMRAPLPEAPGLADVLRLTTLAPNGHNTQPWLFRPGEGHIAILPDLSRRTPVVDPDDHHLFVSLGCAAETFAIAGAAAGLWGTPAFDAAGQGAVEVAYAPGPRQSSPLAAAIVRRQSTRSLYDGQPVAGDALDLLAAAARVPGVELILLTDRARIEAITELVVAGNTSQLADRAFLDELKQWLRFNPGQALASGDGLYAAASGNPTLPAWLGRPLFDLVFRADAENDRYAAHIRSSAGLAVFVSEHDDRDHWVRAGRACQRFSLQATALGLKHAFINQPVEVPALRRQLATLLGSGVRRPDLVMRFGRAPDLPQSPRRPAARVILAASRLASHRATG